MANLIFFWIKINWMHKKFNPPIIINNKKHRCIFKEDVMQKKNLIEERLNAQVKELDLKLAKMKKEAEGATVQMKETYKEKIQKIQNEIKDIKEKINSLKEKKGKIF
jgi:chromosome segregation ATPase